MNGRIELAMSEADYFAHRALSSTGARKILDSPAKFHYDQTHEQATKAAFDLGHAVHERVLGVGAETVVIPADKLAKDGAASTTAAKEFVAEAREAGQTPVKQDVYDEMAAMTEAVLAHPMARILLEQTGNSEASVFATDPDTDVELRARFDRLPAGGSTPIAVDLKTARSASPRGFAKAAAEHGYHVQRGHYMDTYALTDAPELAGFVFVVVESEAPYLVGVYRLNTEFEQIGVQRAREARRIYADCLTTDTWPGYSTDIVALMAPFWAISEAAEVTLA